MSVPKLAGLQVEEANAILKSKGLHIEIIDSIYQKDAVPGAIIEQVPEENSKVKKVGLFMFLCMRRHPSRLPCLSWSIIRCVKLKHF